MGDEMAAARTMCGAFKIRDNCGSLKHEHQLWLIFAHLGYLVLRYSSSCLMKVLYCGDVTLCCGAIR